VSLVLGADARKTVGAKQTLKAMKRNETVQLYIAKDAEKVVVAPLWQCASVMGIPVDTTYSMVELGKACRIKVKAAAVGVLK
jgi:hypothetical protein